MGFWVKGLGFRVELEVEGLARRHWRPRKGLEVGGFSAKEFKLELSMATMRYRCFFCSVLGQHNVDP